MIYPLIKDGTASLQALNEHRRRLGLGPSKNLISSGAFQDPEASRSNTQYAPPQLNNGLFPFLEFADPAHLHSDGNLDGPFRMAGRTHRDDQPPNLGDTDNLFGPDTVFYQEEGRERPLTKRYRGNRALSRNRSADIPNELNCRLWIAGLPPNCTVSELLRCIRGIGPIYATHLVPPLVHDQETATKVNIPTSAASLTFFTASAAHMFLLRHSLHPFTVGGYPTTVSRHRIRTKPAPVDGQSRVVVITGDPEIVNPETLTGLFIEKWNIRFDTDFMEFTPGKESNEIVWGFGSFRAQAQAAYIRLSQHAANSVTIRYIPDPCS
ncbi:hypothetical protein ABKA04_002087 [Annulohypoxylon sp. FPYF3050]